MKADVYASLTGWYKFFLFMGFQKYDGLYSLVPMVHNINMEAAQKFAPV